MSRSALIIGASSMLGGRLTDYLKVLGFHVYTCGRSSQCHIQLDLTDTTISEIPKSLKAEVIFHCAASFASDSNQDCIINEKVNALSAYLVSEIAVSVGCKHLIYAGSISSSTKQGSSPQTSYGASKLRGEDILQWSLKRYHIAFTSLRFPQLYDEYGECCKHQLWFGRIIAYANAGKYLRMPGGFAMRNFIHVSDASRLMYAALKNNTIGRLAITHPELMSYAKITSLAYEIFDNGGYFDIAEEKKPFQKIFIPFSKESFELLKCCPEISMREGLKLIKEKHPQNFGPMDVT